MLSVHGQLMSGRGKFKDQSLFSFCCSRTSSSICKTSHEKKPACSSGTLQPACDRDRHALPAIGTHQLVVMVTDGP